MSELTPDTPGSGAIANIKAQNQAVTLFKKPTDGLRIKSKPKILTEDKYIEELSRIIQRDFFPDLEKLRAQNEYLDAEARKDYAQMAEIRARYSGSIPSSQRRNNALSPATFETPLSNAGNSTPRQHDTCDNTPRSTISKLSTAEGGPVKISTKLSLDAFLQNYTSEDNNSFQEIIETAMEKLRHKFAVLYDHEKISSEKLGQALMLPSIEQQFAPIDPMRKIETWKYTNMNSVMYTPDGVDFTEQERLAAAERKQVVQYSATRMELPPRQQTQDELQTVNKSMAPLTPNGGAQAAGQPATIRGFELLKSPSPRPGEAFSPLMTWGEIEGTPFRLDGSDTPLRTHSGPSFKISENSRRENIGLALAEKVGEKMRAQKQQALNQARKNINSPFIRSNMERLASMSPAAQRLAATKLGLRNTPHSMTPSPANIAKRKSTPLVTKTTARNDKQQNALTPAKSPYTPKHPNSSRRSQSTNSAASTSAAEHDISNSTLTDDLLKIPTKRRRAADFF